MSKTRRCLTALTLSSLLACAAITAARGVQTAQAVLAGAELARVVPPGFYYAGQSAPTQARNSAAARFGKSHLVLAGMVDTSGYSADIRAAYEGFFITDARVAVGAGVLGTGAYGFGFSDDGQFNVFDVGGNKLLSVPTDNDPALARPRPLTMVKAGDGVRLYSGRRFVRLNSTPPDVEL